MSDVTLILSQVEAGDSAATEQLLSLAYDELRRLAAAKLAHEKPGQTLQATALVHEAYLRLVGNGSSNPRGTLPAPSFRSRKHFFAAAAEAIAYRVLRDSDPALAARSLQTAKEDWDYAIVGIEGPSTWHTPAFAATWKTQSTPRTARARAAASATSPSTHVAPSASTEFGVPVK